MGDEVCRNLRIHGRVQGVGYRWSLVVEATRLGLRGWVRNRRDGSVEALVSGSLEAVDALLVWAHRGPSRVDGPRRSRLVQRRRMPAKGRRELGSRLRLRPDCYALSKSLAALSAR
jgi:acylphosphatase